MSGPTPRRRPGRPSLLTRERLAQAAFDLVDAEGVGALTINRLARDLGVSTMTTYGYASSKDEILRMLPDLLLRDLPLADLDQPWRMALEQTFLEVYRRFVKHHHVTQAIADASAFGRAQAEIIEHVLGCLTQAGFDRAEAFELQRTLATYTVGFALFAIAETQGGDRRPRTSWTEDLDPDEIPHVAQIADLLGAEVSETQYLAGLRRILR
jgi:AcrR family transcriptional regulator